MIGRGNRKEGIKDSWTERRRKEAGSTCYCECPAKTLLSYFISIFGQAFDHAVPSEILLCIKYTAVYSLDPTCSNIYVYPVLSSLHLLQWTREYKIHSVFCGNSRSMATNDNILRKKSNSTEVYSVTFLCPMHQIVLGFIHKKVAPFTRQYLTHH